MNTNTCKRALVLLVLVVASAAVGPQAVSAQAQTLCTPGAVTQHDLAGFYANDTMSLSIYPCGGSYIQWTNVYGSHGAAYVTTQRMPDGVIAVGTLNTTGGYLDDSLAIGYKAAEPGYLQIVTSGPFGARVYKVRKLY